jgi:hypothetical protein
VLLKKPYSVTIQVSEPKFITDEGIEAIDVGIHYGHPNGGGKTVCLSFSASHRYLISSEDSQRTQSAGKEWVPRLVVN